MKDLLAYVPPGKDGQRIIDYAVSLASALDAHLEGIAFSFLPEFSGIYATMPDAFYARIEQESTKDAAQAQDEFLRLAVQAGIRHSFRRHVATTADAERIFGRTARCFDIAIVPQTEPDGVTFFNPKLEDTMFLSGRPALFVPSIHKGPASLDRVLVCWNGDRWAARAAADAQPLMKHASVVDVLQIEFNDNGPPECRASELVRHLDRHGIKTRSHVFAHQDPDVGAAILSFAADCGATLIVMGGYGHSRAREFLLGGATREVLKSMTVPVLLSH